MPEVHLPIKLQGDLQSVEGIADGKPAICLCKKVALQIVWKGTMCAFVLHVCQTGIPVWWRCNVCTAAFKVVVIEAVTCYVT